MVTKRRIQAAPYNRPTDRTVQARKAHDRAVRTRNPGYALYALPAWQTLRAQVIREQPRCDACHLRKTQVVDHIVPHRGVRELFFDRSNCHGMCKVCHNRKTGKETGFGSAPLVRPPRDDDGPVIA